MFLKLLAGLCRHLADVFEGPKSNAPAAVRCEVAVCRMPAGFVIVTPLGTIALTVAEAGELADLLRPAAGQYLAPSRN